MNENYYLMVENLSKEIKNTSILNNINKVENIQTIELNQEEFTQQTIGVYADGNLFTEIEVVEKLGITSSPFHFFWNEITPNLPDVGVWRFKCYSDINFPEINYSNRECDALPEVVSNVNTLKEVILTIHPNPFQGQVRISANNQIVDRLRLIDLNGEIVFEKKGIQDEITLDWLIDGIYILEISIGEEIVRKKIIKASH